MSDEVLDRKANSDNKLFDLVNALPFGKLPS